MCTYINIYMHVSIYIYWVETAAGGGNIPDRMRVGMAGNAWNAQLSPHSHFSIFQARAEYIYIYIYSEQKRFSKL